MCFSLLDKKKKGSPLKVKENYQAEIIETARKIYCSSVHQPLYVTVNFDDNFILKRQDVESIAQNFCLAVREIENLDGIFEQVNYLEFWRLKYLLKNQIPKEIAGLWIVRGIKDDELWSVSGGGVITPLSADIIQKCINSKEIKAENYRKHCAEVWLLIVATGAGLSSMFDSRNEDFAQEIYSSSFDKVFLLDGFHNRVYPLNVGAN